MLTAVLSLGSALGYTVHDVLMMRVVRSTPVFTALFWVQSVALVLFVPAWLLFIGLPEGSEEWRAAGLAALSGPVEVLALAALLKALAVGKLSIVAPLAALGGGFGAVFVILLGEPVGGLAVVGLPLAVAGAVLASMEPRAVDEDLGQRRRGVSATAGAGWALLCAAIFGLEPVLFGEAAVLSPLAIVAISRVASLSLLLPLLLVAWGFHLRREHVRPVALSGLLDGFAVMAFAAAAAIGPASTASVLVAQTGTLSALVGMWALKERLARVQIVGIVLAIVAVTLLAVSTGG
ncbi:MAG TPA: EamA family transporter [Thermoleophilia bacterium]|nr:EamA family transporter [Thermoleophilia bacterium]